MPVWPESFIVCFVGDDDFEGLTSQNLEYCKWFPLISDNPENANDVALITDIVLMKREGGGGKMNPINMDNAIASGFSQEISRKIMLKKRMGVLVL